MKNKSTWTEYNKSKTVCSPRPLILEALKKVDLSSKAQALDLGAGSGRDTVELLNRGFYVDAVDRDQSSLDLIPAHDNLIKIYSKFEDLSLDKNKYGIINASFSLSFCHPDEFENFFHHVKRALAIGGVFCGQVFGNKDNWNTFKNMTFYTRKKTEELFLNLSIESFNEVEEDAPSFSEKMKHWHFFEVIAKKVNEK